MSKELDSSWKYTTKVNIASAENLLRNEYYRQGASDFQTRLIEVLEDRMEADDPNILELVKELKK
jgi:hypothetical protein